MLTRIFVHLASGLFLVLAACTENQTNLSPAVKSQTRNFDSAEIQSYRNERLLKRIDHPAPDRNSSSRPERINASKPVSFGGFSFSLPQEHAWYRENSGERDITFGAGFSQTLTFLVQAHWRPIQFNSFLAQVFGTEGAQQPLNIIKGAYMLLHQWIKTMRQHMPRTPRHTDVKVTDLGLVRAKLETTGDICREYAVTAKDQIPGYSKETGPFRMNAIVCVDRMQQRLVELRVSERRRNHEEAHPNYSKDKNTIFDSLQLMGSIR